MRRCRYCKHLRFWFTVQRGYVFGSLICKNRRACDLRKISSQGKGK